MQRPFVWVDGMGSALGPVSSGTSEHCVGTLGVACSSGARVAVSVKVRGDGLGPLGASRL